MKLLKKAIFHLVKNNAFYMPMNLHQFDNINVSTDPGVQVDVKEFYDRHLIAVARPNLVHDQFGQKRDIPQGNGKVIEFRRYEPLPKALTPLQEGVTPKGTKIAFTRLTAEVKQYGAYIETSDIIQMVTIDNIKTENNKALGAQAGETLDTVTREIINAGTCVLYSPDTQSSTTPTIINDRSQITENCPLTIRDIKLASRFLKVNKASKINGSYVAIIHPDQAFNIKNDPKFEEWTKYTTSDKLFAGEIGMIDGVRFVETTEAKIWKGADLTAAARNLTVASISGKVITVDEAITSTEAAALADRKIIIANQLYTITSATAGEAGAAKITIKETAGEGIVDGAVVYPGEGGKEGKAVYSTLVIGENAYGVTELEGGGLQMIAKGLGEGNDPLNQRATQGWKATKTAEILTQTFMVRIESGSEFDTDAN